MITCPACGSVSHERWCAFALTQKAAIEAKSKAIAETSYEGRRKAVIYFHVCEDNLLNSFDYWMAKFNSEREEAERKDQSTQQKSSTHLKNYTPAPERPVVSEPLMDMPVRQPAPQFSSINETNIRHEKPVSIIGKHEWGEISEESLSAFESLMGEEIPREFDIERYNHDKGTVILGTHKDNGRYHWTILCPQPDGSRTLISQEELKGDFFYGSQNVGELRDVHFEGQGTFIIAEYTSGYRQVYDKNGKLFRDGYNIKVLGSMVDGKRLLYVGKDEDTLVNLIFDENGEDIVGGGDIEQYDDAIIVRDVNACYLSNWKGNLLEIGNHNAFEDIKAYNNQGSYYILKDWNKGYAIIGRGFIRYGDWYDTEEEAHRAWRDYHP